MNGESLVSLAVQYFFLVNLTLTLHLQNNISYLFDGSINEYFNF